MIMPWNLSQLNGPWTMNNTRIHKPRRSIFFLLANSDGTGHCPAHGVALCNVCPPRVPGTPALLNQELRRAIWFLGQMRALISLWEGNALARALGRNISWRVLLKTIICLYFKPPKGARHNSHFYYLRSSPSSTNRPVGKFDTGTRLHEHHASQTAKHCQLNES